MPELSLIDSTSCQEKLRHPLHQDAARRRVAHPVAAAGEGQNFNIRPCLDELVDDRERVREVHVVVAGAVGNEQFTFQLRGIFHR